MSRSAFADKSNIIDIMDEHTVDNGAESTEETTADTAEETTEEPAA